MPQKRNPYALPVLRGGAGTLVGRLTGLLATGLTPSARTDNWLYAYGEVAGALDLAGRLVRLGTAVVTGLSVDADVLAEQAVSHFTAAADLAEELSQRYRLDYRTAYRVVGRAVASALARGEDELTVPVLRGAAAEEITGGPRCRSPRTARAPRTTPPRPWPPAAPPAARAPAGSGSTHGVLRRVAAARQWNAARRARIAEAESALLKAARNLLDQGIDSRRRTSGAMIRSPLCRRQSRHWGGCTCPPSRRTGSTSTTRCRARASRWCSSRTSRPTRRATRSRWRSTPSTSPVSPSTCAAPA